MPAPARFPARKPQSPVELDLSPFSSNTRRVEDWEQHFLEKSRRRFEKERLEKRRHNMLRLVAAVAIGATIVGGLAALAILR